MFAQAYDIIEATAVARFKAGGSPDVDYAEFIRAFLSLDGKAIDRDTPILVALVDRRHTPPNALWRKRIAEANARLRSRATFIFVSESTLARGAMHAIAWMLSGQLDVRIVSTFEEARRVAEEIRKRPLPSLATLLAEVEQRLALTTDPMEAARD